MARIDWKNILAVFVMVFSVVAAFKYMGTRTNELLERTVVLEEQLKCELAKQACENKGE